MAIGATRPTRMQLGTNLTSRTVLDDDAAETEAAAEARADVLSAGELANPALKSGKQRHLRWFQDYIRSNASLRQMKWPSISMLSATAAAAVVLVRPTHGAPLVQTAEVVEHHYAFNAPVWSPFARSKPHPLVVWHGLGDSAYGDGMVELKETLEQAYPGLYVHLIALGEDASSDRNRGVFGNANDDVAQVCEDLAGVEQLRGGFDAVGFSQGGQFLRALIQRCDAVKVRNLVTFGSQHMGISDLPTCSPADLLCRLAEGALRGGIYTDYAQSHVISAQYFRDPRTKEKLDRYLESNRFLTDINNEVVLNATYRDRLASLETFVMLQFDGDKTVVPKRSSWFEAYASRKDDNDGGDDDDDETIPLRQSEIYKSDRLGLRTLDKRGGIVLDVCKGRHMQIDAACQLKVFGKYVATPQSYVPRGVLHAWSRIVFATTGLQSTSWIWASHMAFLSAAVLVVQGFVWAMAGIVSLWRGKVSYRRIRLL